MPEDIRKIIHLDMDCFYAAVEMRERPELAGRPIAVGGGSQRGVVTTCNYEARAFGVRSAMPGFKARELCPALVFLPVRFDLYRAESAKIRAILRSYTPLVEPLSLDEAYLDVTALDRYAWDVAREIRATILTSTGLTSSAGVAPNKMLAKIASDWRKPNGQFAIPPEAVADFMRNLPVGKLWGVGPKTVRRIEERNIRTCGDLQALSKTELVRLFGRWGTELFSLCRGIDRRPVVTNRPRKSLSNENTFSHDLPDFQACRPQMESLVSDLLADIASHAANRTIRKCFVKVRFADFTTTTCECLCDAPSSEVFHTLLAKGLDRRNQSVRLLGAGVRFADKQASPQSLLDL